MLLSNCLTTSYRMIGQILKRLLLFRTVYELTCILPGFNRLLYIHVYMYFLALDLIKQTNKQTNNMLILLFFIRMRTMKVSESESVRIHFLIKNLKVSESEFVRI
jgi:hypothetical protein